MKNHKVMIILERWKRKATSATSFDRKQSSHDDNCDDVCDTSVHLISFMSGSHGMSSRSQGDPRGLQLGRRALYEM